MHPVITLPKEYWVHDFTKGPDPNFVCPYAYSIGRYDEVRPGMYHQDLFQGERELHVGVDIGAPIGEPIYAFSDGTVYSMGINEEEGSYGPTIITQHLWQGRELWALHGHLAVESLSQVSQGQQIKEGDIIAFVGSKEVNGGWDPHLHFQLSWKKPKNNDMPGVVKTENREESLKIYPDPRMILGPIY